MKPLKTVEEILQQLAYKARLSAYSPGYTKLKERPVETAEAKSEIYQLMLSLVDGTKEVTFDGEELLEADSEWNECVNYIKQKLSEHFNGEGET